MALDAKQIRELGGKWMDRIRAAEKREERWINAAKRAEAIYLNKPEDGAGEWMFNVLHSNVETIVPAIYSATPKPDIRRRYGDKDPTAKQVADLLERAISSQIDDGALDPEMEGVAQSAFVAGRGLIRVRLASEDVQTGEIDSPDKTAAEETAVAYEDGSLPPPAGEPGAASSPPLSPGAAPPMQRLTFEAVPWQDFRFGPAKRWDDVPWVSFRHMIDSETIQKWEKADSVQAQLKLSKDDVVDAAEDREGDVEVWEVWDKRSKTVKFIRAGDGLVYRDEEDPLQLSTFFPCSRPVQPIEVVGKLCPVTPFDVYEELARELDDVTVRIRAVVKGIKAKGGVPAGEMMKAMEDLALAGDNELIELRGVEAFAQQGGLDKAVLWWPIEQLILALRELAEHRERIKAAIYEITGISDIVRGASNAQETATAQQIKSQWGSLRIQKMQRMLERCVRDVFLISAELIASAFTPQTLQLMTGIQMTPEMHQLLTNDVARFYKVDVETDSTIKSDITKSKTEMTEFLAGTAQYVQAIGPLVQQGAMPAPVAVTIFISFARVFRLGKSVEDELEKLLEQSLQQAANPQQQPEDPKIAMEREKHQQDMQMAQEKHAFDMQSRAQEMEQKQALQAAEMESKKAAQAFDMEAQTMKGQRDAEAHQIAMAEKQQMMNMKGGGTPEMKAITQLSEAVQSGIAMMMEALTKAQQEGSQQLAQALLGAIQQANEQVIAAVNSPRQVEAVRGKDGRVSGAVSRPAQVN